MERPQPRAPSAREWALGALLTKGTGMPYTQPTAEEVGAFTVLLTGLVAAAQGMGTAKVCHSMAKDGLAKGKTTDQVVEQYAEREELTKLGLEAQWEAVQAWLTDHMPEGTLPPSCRRG